MHSVLEQTGVDFELLVVDDGSTDVTGKILDRAENPRLIALRRPSIGRARALDEAIRKSRGRYLIGIQRDARLMPAGLLCQAGLNINQKD